MSVGLAVLTEAGSMLVEKVGRLWLARRDVEEDRTAELSELMAVRFRDEFARRNAERQLADIADSLAKRLQPLCVHEYRGLTDNDKAAAVQEASNTLARADLSDDALFSVDMDPVRLARQVRGRLPERDLHAELGEAGARFYRVVLDECCQCLVHIVRELPQFGTRVQVETLERLSGLADQVAVVLERLPERSLDAPEGDSLDEEFRRRYTTHISATQDYIVLLGVPIKRYRPRTSLSVSYISLRVSTSADRRHQMGGLGHGDPDVLGAAGWRDADRAPGEATVQVETALSEHRLMLLRGDAGSGKSTLLRWLAISAARGAFTAELRDWNGRTPFLVKLRSYADRSPPAPEEFLDDVAGTIAAETPRGWVHRQLRSGRALLLIDGVDELPTNRRRAVRDWLRELLTSFPEIRVVVTSRPAAASARWLTSEGFAAASLEPMDPAGTKALIGRWHSAIADSPDLPCAPAELAGYEGRLLGRLEAAPHLRALATNPLLAAMLCALHLDRQQLPTSRMGVYKATLEMLLERRDTERDVLSSASVSLEYEQQLRILQHLAGELSASARIELPQSTAEKLIGEQLDSMPHIDAGKAGEVLAYLMERSGVLQDPAMDRVGFIHRTVQEYLTALRAADRGDMDLMLRKAHLDTWRETVIMAAGHANGPQRTELVTGIVDRIDTESRHARKLRLVLAACLETLETVPPELQPRIDGCLTRLIPPRNLAAAHSLATAGRAVLDRLPGSLDGLSHDQAQATVRTAWLANGPKALEVLERYRHDPRLKVQRELEQGWRYFDPEEYARRVLADAPLWKGWIEVRTPGTLRALHHLEQLRRLWSQEMELSDLEFLRGLSPLRELGLDNTAVEDLTPVTAHADSLTEFAFSSYHPLRSMTPLYQLPRLRNLELIVPGLTSLDFLRDLPPLQALSLSLRDIGSSTNYAPIAAHVGLEHLRLVNCQPLDVDLLHQLGNLRSLRLDRCTLNSGLAGLAAVIPEVTSLVLAGMEWVADLRPLANLSLESLTIHHCRTITDFASLADLSTLTALKLSETEIDDLTPLRMLRNLQFVNLILCPNLRDLTPLAALPNLQHLYLHDASPDLDLAPFRGHSDLQIHIEAGQQVRNRKGLGRGVRVIET